MNSVFSLIFWIIFEKWMKNSDDISPAALKKVSFSDLKWNSHFKKKKKNSGRIMQFNDFIYWWMSIYHVKNIFSNVGIHSSFLPSLLTQKIYLYSHRWIICTLFIFSPRLPWMRLLVLCIKTSVCVVDPSFVWRLERYFFNLKTPHIL